MAILHGGWQTKYHSCRVFFSLTKNRYSCSEGIQHIPRGMWTGKICPPRSARIIKHPLRCTRSRATVSPREWRAVTIYVCITKRRASESIHKYTFLWWIYSGRYISFRGERIPNVIAVTLKGGSWGWMKGERLVRSVQMWRITLAGFVSRYRKKC